MFLRKKIERGIVLGFAAAALLMASGFAEQQTSVVVGEAPLVFEKGAEPVVQNDRNLLPLRKIGEALDAAVYWIAGDTEDSSIIQIVTEERMLAFNMDTDIVGVFEVKNGKAQFVTDIHMDGVKPQLINGRTYVPLRFAADPLLIPIEVLRGVGELTAETDNRSDTVNWDEKTSTVTIPKRSAKEAQAFESVLNLPPNSAETYVVEGRIIYDGENQKLYLQDEQDSSKQIWLKEYPDAENFWRQQLGVSDPNGIKVRMSGFVFTDEGSGEKYLAVKRSTTGILPIRQNVSLHYDRDDSPIELYVDGNSVQERPLQIPIGAKVDMKAAENNRLEDWVVTASWDENSKSAVLSPGVPFTMPNTPVEIQIETAAYKVQLPNNLIGGTITAKPASANVGETVTFKAGETVTLSIDAEEGYLINKEPAVKAQGGETVDVTEKNGSYSFAMPKGDVTVSAEFFKIPKYSYRKPEGAEYTVTMRPEAGNIVIAVDFDPGKMLEEGKQLYAVYMDSDGRTQTVGPAVQDTDVPEWITRSYKLVLTEPMSNPDKEIMVEMLTEQEAAQRRENGSNKESEPKNKTNSPIEGV